MVAGEKPLRLMGMLLCPSACPPLQWCFVPPEKGIFVFMSKTGNPFISTERGVLDSLSPPQLF